MGQENPSKFFPAQSMTIKPIVSKQDTSASKFGTDPSRALHKSEGGYVGSCI